jgi:hypothetical protein
MKRPQTGGCQCGKLRYEVAEEPQSVPYPPLPGLPTPDQHCVVHGSARCEANGPGSIVDGLGRVPGVDVG